MVVYFEKEVKLKKKHEKGFTASLNTLKFFELNQKI